MLRKRKQPYVWRDAQQMGFTALVIVVAAVLLGAVIAIMVIVFRER